MMRRSLLTILFVALACPRAPRADQSTWGRKGRVGQKVELEGRWRVDRFERGMPVLVREAED